MSTSVVMASDVVSSATGGDSLGGSDPTELVHSDVTFPDQSGPGCAPSHFPADCSLWLKVGDEVEALTKGKLSLVKTVVVVDSLVL